MRHAPLYWLLIAFAIPVGAAWTLALHPEWRPHTGNHGELIDPPIHLGVGRDWVMVVPVADTCAAQCKERLQLLERVRRGLGVEGRRVEAIACLASAHVAPCAGLGAALNDGTALVIIDPMGNAVLRYAEGFSPFDLLDDMERLLRVSKNWRSDGKH